MPPRLEDGRLARLFPFRSHSKSEKEKEKMVTRRPVGTEAGGVSTGEPASTSTATAASGRGYGGRTPESVGVSTAKATSTNTSSYLDASILGYNFADAIDLSFDTPGADLTMGAAGSRAKDAVTGRRREPTRGAEVVQKPAVEAQRPAQPGQLPPPPPNPSKTPQSQQHTQLQAHGRLPTPEYERDATPTPREADQPAGLVSPVPTPEPRRQYQAYQPPAALGVSTVKPLPSPASSTRPMPSPASSAMPLPSPAASQPSNTPPTLKPVPTQMAPPRQIPAAAPASTAATPPSRVYDSPPLSRLHHECLHKHSRMLRVSNRFYPLTCQACRRADTDDFARCSWCALRVCAPCAAALRLAKGDLTSMINDS